MDEKLEFMIFFEKVNLKNSTTNTAQSFSMPAL